MKEIESRYLLLLAALAAFGASIASGFHFDDYAIFSDPVLGSGTGWLQVWALRQTRPLTYLTFWLNRQIGGGDPLGYHLVNLAIHLGAVLLAWACLRRLLPERVALIAAALFAIHPIQSEAVNYVWARSILLAGLLSLAALWHWIEGRHWIAVAWFALALLAKEEVAAFPLLLAWLEWRGATKCKSQRCWAPIAAMLALATVAGARVIWATTVIPGAPAGVQAGISPFKYLLAQGQVILRYLQLLLLPYGFTVDPEIRPAVWLSLLGWAVVLGLVVLALLRSPAVGTWLVGGLLLLLPSSSIFPAADLSADRRLYLPMIAFGAAIGLVLSRIRPAPILAVIAVILLGISVDRTVIWMSEESLWREAVERAPDKVRPKLQLARALPAAKALELLNHARLAAPYEPAIAAEMGKILLSEGQVDGALEEFGRALALNPTSPQYINNRGVALQALGQTEAARADFVRALALDSHLTEARDNLAKLPPAPQQ
jgi:tetratricopeptide (TPR) repeat protein